MKKVIAFVCVGIIGSLLTYVYSIKNNSAIFNTEFVCESGKCHYKVEVYNYLNQSFDGFVHIYGYKGTEEDKSLFTESYEPVQLKPGESKVVLLGSRSNIKPDFIEHSLRTKKYMGWLGPCDHAIYSFDFKNKIYTAHLVLKYTHRPWTYTFHQGVIGESNNNRYKVSIESEPKELFIEPDSDFFEVRMFSAEGKSEGYAQACDIVELQDELEFIEAQGNI